VLRNPPLRQAPKRCSQCKKSEPHRNEKQKNNPPHVKHIAFALRDKAKELALSNAQK